MSEFNSTELIKKYEALRRKSKYVFGQQMSDDVAHDAILSILEGKSIRQRNKFALIDAVRRNGGSGNYSRNGALVPTFPNKLSEIDIERDHEDRFGAVNESDNGYTELLFNFVCLVSFVKRPKRVQVLILYCIYEFTMDEISKLLGVNKSRVSQIFKSAKIDLESIALQKGLLQKKPKENKTESKESLSENSKNRSLLEAEERKLEEIYKTEKENPKRICQTTFFKIPKAIFPTFGKTKKVY